MAKGGSAYSREEETSGPSNLHDEKSLSSSTGRTPGSLDLTRQIHEVEKDSIRKLRLEELAGDRDDAVVVEESEDVEDLGETPSPADTDLNDDNPAQEVNADMMTVDQLITFLLYQIQLGGNLYSIGYVMTGLMECVGASRKVFEYMLRVPAIANDGKGEPPLQGYVEFKDVHFTYPSRPNNPALKGLNLVIQAGRTTALVGPSGGGKSSIVALIQHFYEPNEGTITIDGVNVRDISHMYFHHKIALVAQEPVLYNGSILSNILYGCDWATEEDMLRAAHTAS